MRAHPGLGDDFGLITETRVEKGGFAPHRIKIFRCPCCLQMSRVEVALHGMLCNARLHAIVAPAKVEQHVGAFVTELGFQFGSRPAQAGNKLPAVTTRRTEADLFGFDEDYRKTALRAGQSGLKGL